jgi:hypothetical protein
MKLCDACFFTNARISSSKLRQGSKWFATFGVHEWGDALAQIVDCIIRGRDQRHPPLLALGVKSEEKLGDTLGEDAQLSLTSLNTVNGVVDEFEEAERG